MTDLNTLIEPEELTNPTQVEYKDAYNRLLMLNSMPQTQEQIIRDMHTIQWFHWVLGWEGRG